MEFAEKLIRGVITNNYKNLILDVQLRDDSIVSVFCSEYNGMKDIYTKGAEVFLSKTTDNRRRLKYECQIVNKGDGMVFVNPMYNEALFLEGIRKGIVNDFKGCAKMIRRRSDMSDKYNYFEFIAEDGTRTYVFLDNIYNKQGGYAVFPSGADFVTINLLNDMKELREKGVNTVIFKIVPRSDCLDVKFSWGMNQVAAAKVYDEAKSGLKFICYGCNVTTNSVEIDKKMKILV